MRLKNVFMMFRWTNAKGSSCSFDSEQKKAIQHSYSSKVTFRAVLTTFETTTTCLISWEIWAQSSCFFCQREWPNGQHLIAFHFKLKFSVSLFMVQVTHSGNHKNSKIVLICKSKCICLRVNHLLLSTSGIFTGDSYFLFPESQLFPKPQTVCRW